MHVNIYFVNYIINLVIIHLLQFVGKDAIMQLVELMILKEETKHKECVKDLLHNPCSQELDN